MKTYKRNVRCQRCCPQYIPYILVASCVLLLLHECDWEAEKIDWHDHEFISMEEKREGIGEHGEPAELPFDHDNSKCDAGKVIEDIGYNGCLSDYISVNRSVRDYRHKDCRYKKYLRRLPKISIIIPVFNEHWSILLRALHSIFNRTPAQLIEELILIDDGSTNAQMKEPLDDYIALHFPKARIFHLPPPRKGLMGARLLGARNASAEVLVFLDSNLEVGINWLPPLLEPIAENYETCVCPIVDIIDTRTLEHTDIIGEGPRNAFSWKLLQDRHPPLPEHRTDPTKPFKSPAMIGCAFAISSTFFWRLGGFDTGLRVWGGEQYELAFKVWMCGGTLVDAPCSRVAHLFREQLQPFANPGAGDYIGRNYRRIMDVWMDEYAQYVYLRLPHLRMIDPGDLSKQRELRRRLRCKPFKWYMEEVAFDIPRKRPLVDPPDYGSGKIMPALNTRLCLTAARLVQPVGVRDCSLNGRVLDQQKFFLSHRKQIELQERHECLHVQTKTPSTPVLLLPCEDLGMGNGNQLWKYDLETQQLLFDRRGELCLEYDPTTRNVFVGICDHVSETQKWIIDYVNTDAMEKWNETAPLVRDSFFS